MKNENLNTFNFRFQRTVILRLQARKIYQNFANYTTLKVNIEKSALWLRVQLSLWKSNSSLDLCERYSHNIIIASIMKCSIIWFLTLVFVDNFKRRHSNHSLFGYTVLMQATRLHMKKKVFRNFEIDPDKPIIRL